MERRRCEIKALSNIYENWFPSLDFQKIRDMNMLTFRGPEKKTPLQLPMGVSPNFLSVGEG
eukprot:snap_masked-scaffold_46-processed-gene-1.84-mRNA-1 protein AED:1.00 eAED:1.00 QI:0/0/0/0/1/1/2/0/60